MAVVVDGEAAPQAPPQLRAETNIVVVDVSVLDRDRRPISGLTAADFTIRERGVPRPVVTFAPVKVEQPVAVPVGWMRDIPADVQTNDIRDGRLLVLAIDERTAGDPVHTRRIAHAILDEMGPSDLAAVAYVVRSQSSQDFTNDRAKLRAAVDRSNWTQPAGGSASSSWTLKNVLEQLAKVPDRRKTIYFISGGVNLDFSLIAPNGDWRIAEAQGNMRYSLGQLQDILRLAQRSNVNIHTIDPNGLTVGRDPRDIDPDRNKRDYLMTLAEETGGRAIVQNNTPSQQVPALFAQDGSYYMLGFAPSEPLDGKFRRLEVKVNRDDVEVRSRSGYYVIPTLFHRGGTATAAAKEGGNLAGTIPNSGVQMTLHAAPIGLSDGKSSVLFTLGLNMMLPAMPPAESVAAEFAAFDDYGKVHGSARARLVLNVKAGLNQAIPYQLYGRIDLKPGRYNVRAAVHLEERDKRGTVFTDVTVPDFSRELLSLSGLVLQRSPVPIGGPASVVAGLVPINPTTSREFDRGDRVDVWFRVHQAGKVALRPVTTRVEIQDAQGTVVLDRAIALNTGDFTSNRSSDHQFPLTLTGLRPGPHRLTIDASIDSKIRVTRTVRFSMR